MYALGEAPGGGAEIFSTGRITTRWQRSRVMRTLLSEGRCGWYPRISAYAFGVLNRGGVGHAGWRRKRRSR